MRFLVAMHYAPPHVGGMEAIAARQCSALHERGHDVELLTCRHARSLPRDETTPTHSVHRYRSLDLLGTRSGVTFPVISPAAWRDISRRVARADMVHVHDVFYPLSWLVALAALIHRTPMYLTQHVALVDHPSRLVMAVQRAVFATIGRLLFRQARGVVVYHENIRDFLLSLGVAAPRIRLVGNGVDTETFTPSDPAARVPLRTRLGLSPEVPVAVFVGRLVPKKGFDLVARAGSPDRLTVIVGGGTVPSGLARPDVVFHGPACEDAVRDLLRAADVFVFPATGELLTLAMQEAMACGLPVVVGDDPGYAGCDLDRDLVRFVDLTDRDPGRLRAAVDEVLADPERRAAMSRYSRELAVDRFSWRTNYPAEYAVYDLEPAAA